MYFATGILPRLMGDADGFPPPAFARRYNVYFQKDPPAFPAFLRTNRDSLDASRLVFLG
jgi:hypothetical protein